MNGIGYFTLARATYLIKNVYEILKPDGVCRFGTQDLEIITQKYQNNDPNFQCDRINEWFNGYEANGKKCKYVYDYDALSGLFFLAGFEDVQPVTYNGGVIKGYDNRPEQQFFLEAVK
jgi:predicted SAM-dependent methyltransferase